jgi:hypothetical protein
MAILAARCLDQIILSRHQITPVIAQTTTKIRENVLAID